MPLAVIAMPTRKSQKDKIIFVMESGKISPPLHMREKITEGFGWLYSTDYRLDLITKTGVSRNLWISLGIKQ